MNKLSTRQAGILLSLSVVSAKFNTYPAIYARFAGINGYIAVIINLLMDLLVIAILLWIIKQFPQKTMMQLVEDFFGKAITKLFYFILFVYLWWKAVVIMNAHHNYVLESLFGHLDWSFYIIPLLFLLAFMMSKSLRSLGRSAEIFFPVVLVAVLVTIFIPVKELDLSNLLPVLSNGFKPVMSASFYTSFSVGDYIVLIMISGKIKLKKNTYKSLFLYSAISVVLVSIFYIIFFSTFGELAANQTLAIKDLPLFTSFPSVVGRIDWITINLWTIALIFQIGLLLSFSLECFNSVFNLKNKAFSILIINLMVLAFAYLLFFNISQELEIITSPHFNAIIMSFQILLLICIFVSALVKRRENFAIYKKINAK